MRGTLAINSGLLSFVSMPSNRTLQIGAAGAVNLTAAHQPTGTGSITNAGHLNMAAGSGTTNAIISSGTLGVTDAVTTGAITFNTGSLLTLADGNAAITSSGAITVNSGAKLAVLSASGFTAGSQKKILAGTSATGLFQFDVTNVSPGAGLHWVDSTDGQNIYLGIQHALTLPPGGDPSANCDRGRVDHRRRPSHRERRHPKCPQQFGRPVRRGLAATH